MKSFFHYIAGAMLIVSPAARADGKLKALIIDGQNNHKEWPKTTIIMRGYLEETGLYEVDIARTKFTWNGQQEAAFLPLAGVSGTEDLPNAKTDPDFKPDFSKYDVVISNFGFQAAPWPEETQRAFEKYMKSGPYVYIDRHGKIVRDDKPGPCGTHGPRNDFLITIRDKQHPVTRALPDFWMHADDECYSLLRGPAENMTILVTASEPEKLRVEGRNEPMLMTIDYGKGRVFHTTLGHHTPSFECVGFMATFKRGVEWAATGKVTQTDIPEDFPTAEAVSKRPFKAPAK